MSSEDSRGHSAAWQHLMLLLEPVHAQAAGMARRLAASTDDGDDLFQEAVLRALAALPGLRDPSRFRPWFYTILLSVHRNRTRRSFWKRFLPFETGVTPENEPAGDDGSAWEEERQRSERLSRALASLPAEQREAVVLFELEGFSIEEIAALQQVSNSAVKSRLARGRERLRRIYTRWGLGFERVSSRNQPVAAVMRPALASVAPEERRHD